MRSRLMYALFGVLATLVGVAAGHLVAALLNPASSPVLAVGSQVIDLTPTDLKEWAIRHFGSNDKRVLIGSVMGGVLMLAGVAGLLARRRFVYGAGLQVLLVGVAAFTALHRPAAEGVDVVPSLAAVVTGVGALWLLVRRVPAVRGAQPDDDSAAAPGARGSGDAALSSGHSRRGVLITAGVLAAAAAVMGGAGRLIGQARAKISDIAFPAAADAAPALPAGLDRQVPGITPFRTSNADFYRVDTRLDVPVVDIDSWSLTIDGMVDKKLSFSFQDLLDMPLIERDITLTCVSNSVGGPYVGGARWLGVRLTDLLEQAGVQDGVDQIFSTDVDGMTIGTPYDLATDGRDAMIVVAMNGEPLPREHGYPVRMVVPGLYGFISACKWIEKITLTTYADQDSYWTKREWATDAPIKISSRIDTPKVLEKIPSGDTFIGGVAWAQQNGGVAKVQVRIDGEAWQDAQLGPSGGNDYWRQWFIPWKATSGSHTLACRVVDGAGQVQTDVRADPFPSGSSGVQSLVVTVA
ncbi:molybdopterin-dependent oxidoreductase [Nocardioides anomalus]|uniref:Molybdopterin-dependent oxidoreductase n=1 Tax=Nocardioides anomalus TaxID=2712223 RepID=A0A6G6WJR8_9ACTN|nr:molybdopterin-dependent oxidoreductase [Nocardioides anomalus]QIG45335.1 molybdopterin-dependent oxidoreductase [Nocardioides anomalus]